MEEFEAAVKIQSVFRGFIDRLNAAKFDRENIAACKIQKAWRKYRANQRIKTCREILALRKIAKCVRYFRRRLKARDRMERLNKLDKVLKFYPAKSKDPVPVKRIKGKKKKAPSVRKKKAPRPRPFVNVEVRVLRPKGPPKKRKVLVELPPPWKNKDIRRLATSIKEEMIFNQKNNFAWAKKELLTLLIKRCKPRLDERDVLLKKNQQFKERQVTKPYISFHFRSTKILKMKTVKRITPIENINQYFVNSNSNYSIVDIASRNDDIVSDTVVLSSSSPFYDVIVHPSTGMVFAINLEWELISFENGKVYEKFSLNPPNKIPMISNFLFIDRAGLLWAFLFPQKGDTYCFDPITLQPTLVYSLSYMAGGANNAQIRKAISFLPLYTRDGPVGIAFSYSDIQEVLIYSRELTSQKRLHFPEMTGRVLMKQLGNYLYIWSTDKIIYAYSLHEQPARMELIGKIECKSTITDITSTANPSLLFVAGADSYVRVYASKSYDVSIKLPQNKMTPAEQGFADRLLGPVDSTRSRSIFSELGKTKLPFEPLKINVITISETLLLLIASFPNGCICTTFVTFLFFQMKALEFDDYNLTEDDKQKLVTHNSKEFGLYMDRINPKRIEYFKELKKIHSFVDAASIGQLSRIFNKKGNIFNLTSFILSHNLRQFYHFIPPVPPNYISVYEAFTFLKRAEALHSSISTFSLFVDKYSSASMKRSIPETIRGINRVLPVKTEGPFQAIVNIPFGSNELDPIIQNSNPLHNLNQILSEFTLTDITQKHAEAKQTAPNSWIVEQEKFALLKKIKMLDRLEALVQVEMYNRVMVELSNSFRENLYPKGPMVPALEIPDSIPFNEPQGNYDNRRNRNPLLYNKMHKCIYESWAEKVLYRIDPGLRMALKMFILPRKYFDSSSVMEHFRFVHRLSNSNLKPSSSIVYVGQGHDRTTRLVVSEDLNSLPLSHYLTVHGFLGADSKLIATAKTILIKLLTSLQQLHRKNIICRTVHPDNIMISNFLNVTFSTIYDCQYLETHIRSLYVPLPAAFTDPGNPFLPPEFFHAPPRKYTTAFDVWQFGILMLYMITGSLPVSYGSELIKHIDKETRIKLPTKDLGDPPLYPKIDFFYDWLVGFNIACGNEKCTGERGECYIQGQDKDASILKLGSYRLLPFKSNRSKVDEAKVLIEIIANCLQIDPAKRPKVSDLLRTVPFALGMVSNENLDTYIRNPDPTVFVSQFFAPVLDNVDRNFKFALGICSAMIFKDDNNDDDREYSFPLDGRASEEVLKSLFKLHFLDTLVAYTIKNTIRVITIENVSPMVKFSNPVFDSMYNFFERYLTQTDHRNSMLTNYIDEVSTSLLSLYTGNPVLRLSSSTILENESSMSLMSGNDSAAYFMFTYHRMTKLVKKLFDGLLYKSLKRNQDHNDNYFNSFVEFAPVVNELSKSIVFSIDKQKVSALRTIISKFNSGQQTYMVRLFIDFNVPQKVISLLPLKCTRVEAFRFLISCLKTIRAKSTSSALGVLRSIIHSAPVFLQTCFDVKQGEKNLACEIIRQVTFGESALSFIKLVYSDVVWTVVENSNEPLLSALVTDMLSYSSIFILQLILSSQSLRFYLQRSGIEFMERIECDSFDGLDLYDALSVGKQLSASLFICQGSLPDEHANSPPPIKESVEFLKKALTLALNETDRIVNELDDNVMKNTRFDPKGTVFNKAKNTARSTDFNDVKGVIQKLCDTLLHLFRSLCFYWRQEFSDCPKHLFEFLQSLVVADIGYAKTMSHPAYIVHRCIQRMFIFSLTDMPDYSTPRILMRALSECWVKVMERDLSFVTLCIEKDIVQIQLTKRYFVDKKIRQEMFEALVFEGNINNIHHLFKFIIDKMLYNVARFAPDTLLGPKKKSMYPIRFEAVSMIISLLRNRENHKPTAKRLADEMLASDFIERETKITEGCSDMDLISSSILLLKMVVLSTDVFDDKYLHRCERLLESLCMRYTRDWDGAGIDQAYININASQSIISTTRARNLSMSDIKTPQKYLTVANTSRLPNFVKSTNLKAGYSRLGNKPSLVRVTSFKSVF